MAKMYFNETRGEYNTTKKQGYRPFNIDGNEWYDIQILSREEGKTFSNETFLNGVKEENVDTKIENWTTADKLDCEIVEYMFIVYKVTFDGDFIKSIVEYMKVVENPNKVNW